MRNQIRITWILVGLIAMGGTAVAQDRYFNAELGIADVDGFNNGLVVIGGYGFQVPEVSKNFFVEGEISATLNDPDVNNAELSYYTLGGYGVYLLPVADKVNLRGRAGLLYYDANVTGTAGGTAFSADDDGFELTYGIGVTIAVRNQLDVVVDYTQIESDITHLSAGIQYRF